MTLLTIVGLHWPVVWENSLALSYMLVRIENEVGKKKLLSQSQAGFRKNNRTTYQIMTLFTLIKKSLEEGKYLYTCFVYFRKVYDSIYRQRLIYNP